VSKVRTAPLFFLIFWILAVATRVAAVEPREITGIWRDQNGATIELRGDGTYRSHFADEFGTGTWRLEKGVALTVEVYMPYLKQTSRAA
jgi:hypothetical protein